MTEEFDQALREVFEGREAQFSSELRTMLRLLWASGVRLGLYLERERKEVPPGIFEKPPRRRKKVQEDDVRRQPGKLAELAKAKEKVIEKAEDLSVELEHQLDYEPTLGLGGQELLKARHRFLGQVHKIDQVLTKLLADVRQFKIHSY